MQVYIIKAVQAPIKMNTIIEQGFNLHFWLFSI